MAPRSDAAAAGGDVSTDAPTDEELAANPNLRFEKPRHRAQKDKARPGDVPRIQELSRKNKELTQQLEAALKAQQRPQPAAEPAPRQPEPTPAAASTFSKPMPKIEDFSSEADPYEAMVLAKADWRFEKRQFDADQAKQAEQRKTDDATAAAQWQQTQQGYQTRHDAFTKLKPDFPTKLAALTQSFGGDVQIPGPAYRAILTADNGPAMLYHLCDHPDQLAEMVALWDGKPATEQNVALATRWLSKRAETGTTGAVPSPVPITRTPKPPTPVRTGPMQTGQEPPGDGASLADHEQFFHARKRR